MFGLSNLAKIVHDNLDKAFDPANPPLPHRADQAPNTDVCRSLRVSKQVGRNNLSGGLVDCIEGYSSTYTHA